MMIRWLHLSDLHSRIDKIKDIKIVLNALWADLENLISEDHQPNFICFTGDIAYAGKLDQYKLAEELFFDPLLTKTNLQKENLIWVPGNHDVDREIIKSQEVLEKGLLSSLLDRSELNKFFDENTDKDGKWYKNTELAQAFKRLIAYSKFTSLYFGISVDRNNPIYYTSRIINVENIRIGIAGLNSAWRCSSENDEGCLLIGERQIDSALEEIENSDIKIALFHHPLDWLSGFDKRDAKHRLHDKFNFIHHGHLHDPGATQSVIPIGECFSISAGSLFEGRALNGYALIEYDSIYNKGIVYFRRYYDDRRVFDKDLHSSDNGEFSFDLKITKATPKRMPIIKIKQRNPLFEEIKDWLEALGYDIIPDLNIKTKYICFKALTRFGISGIHSLFIICLDCEITITQMDELEKINTKVKVDEKLVISKWPIPPHVSEYINSHTIDFKPISLREFLRESINSIFNPYFEILTQKVEDNSIPEYYVNSPCDRLIFDQNGQEVARDRYDIIDNYIDTWLNIEDKSHISIIGDFGSGKTWFCLHYAYRQLQRLHNDPVHKRIPLLIPLREYASNQKISSMITDLMSNTYKIDKLKVGFKSFNILNERGKFLLILDGFDEMVQKVDHDRIVENFRSLSELIVPNCKIILTSRASYFRYNKEMATILNAAELKLSNSISKRQTKFIIIHLLPFTDMNVYKVFMNRLGETKGKHTFKMIRTIRVLWGLSHHQIMIKMIIDTLESIGLYQPKNTADIYHYYTKNLLIKNFEEHRTTIVPEQMLIIMENLAWKMFKRLKHRIHYTILTELIKPYFPKEQVEKNIDRLEFISIHIGTQSLLSRSGEYFEFAHKSLMEYFIARKAIKMIRESNLDDSSAEILHNAEILYFLRDMVCDNDKELLKKLIHQNEINVKTIGIDLYRYFVRNKSDAQYLEGLFNQEKSFRVKNKLVASIFQNYKNNRKLSKYIEFFKINEKAFFEDNLIFFGGTLESFRRGARERLINPLYKNKILIYIYMLGLVGENDDIDLLSRFLQNTTRLISKQASESITRIRERNQKTQI